jgi:hypothetical protein
MRDVHLLRGDRLPKAVLNVIRQMYDFVTKTLVIVAGRHPWCTDKEFCRRNCGARDVSKESVAMSKLEKVDEENTLICLLNLT